MDKIILIETSTALCSVALAENGVVTAYRESSAPKAHASLTAVFVQEVLSERGLVLGDCDAVCVSKGPGSYTGLRVGVSTAKGLCFGSGKPLLAVGTLDTLVAQAEGEYKYIIPMIDARRMEVYACVFENGAQITETEPVIVDENSFAEDRYKGCLIPFYRFKGREKHGISVQDWDFHNQIDISFEGCSANVERIDWARHQIEMNHRFQVNSISFRSLTRKVNHILAYLDRITVYDRIVKDDVSIVQFLPNFTLAQITEFFKAAQENNCTNVTAILLEYKNANFTDFDPMDVFALEDM